MKNKVIGLLITISLVLSILPINISYAEVDSAGTKSVNMLSAFGIMDIDENTGKFWDETPVERGEFAKILCALLKCEATADDVPKFNDVSDKERPFVETIVRMGYMSGYSDKEFGARDYVTRGQLIKVLIGAIGAGKSAKSLGGYPDGYVKMAQMLGIFNKYTSNLQKTATRIEVADMIYEMLHADIPIFESAVGSGVVYKVEEDRTFLSEVMGIYQYEGLVSALNNTSLDGKNGVGYKNVKIGDTVYEDPKGLADEYLGCDVKAYVYMPDKGDIGELVYVELKKTNNIIKIEDEDIQSVEGFKLTYFNGKNSKKTLNLASVCRMIYNGYPVVYDADRFFVENGYVELIDNDSDNVYDVAKITSFDTYIAQGIGVDGDTISLKYNEKPIELKNSIVTVFKNGESASLKDISDGSVLLVAASENTDSDRIIRIEISDNRVMGKVDSIYEDEDDTFVKIGDSTYKYTNYCKKLVSNNYLPALKVGESSGQFFTDGRGNLVYYVAVSGYSSVGYMYFTKINTDDDELLVKIYTQDDKLESYTANEKIIINGTRYNISDLNRNFSIKENLQTAQLVEYRLNNGTLTRIDFAKDSYDAQEFSNDISGNLKCSSKNVIDYRYSVNEATRVFRVPKHDPNSSDYLQVMSDPVNYSIGTGSRFTGGNYYNLKLYDINSDNEVKYAVWTYSPTSSDVWEYHPLLVVAAVNEAIDNDGNIIRKIYGFGETGDKIELESAEVESVKDKTLDREVKCGDVIQYRTNSNGKIAEVIIQHSVDDNEYLAPTYLQGLQVVIKCYGNVMKNMGSALIISAKDIWDSMTPLDADLFVGDNGQVICVSDRAVYKTSLAEIDRGDKVFVCLNESNKTRMVVVYK